MKKFGWMLLVLAAMLMTATVGNCVEEIATHTYDVAGEYTVTLTATDEHGGVSSKTITINVRGNEAPVINIVVDKSSGIAPLTVQFTATVTDPDGDAIVDYEWNFGDNGIAKTLSPKHTYTTAGNYTSTFRATDSNNNTSEKSITIIVQNESVGGCSSV